MKRAFSVTAILLLAFGISVAQSYTGSKTNGVSSVYVDSSSIIGWASTITVERGYINISDKNLGLAEAGESGNALGKADNFIVSLGDSGVAVVGFNNSIRNIPGSDFAVFENSFDGSFLELAFVEVSSDSLRWVRFPSVSLTQTDNQIDSYGLIDPLNIINLAGKYKIYYGTPFDLDNIIDSADIDLNDIRFVKIIDVVGSIVEDFGSRDSQGNIINDPWPTPFASSGFDLDAVAVLGLPTSNFGLESPVQRLFPVPASEIITIEFNRGADSEMKIIGSNGQIIESIATQGLINTIDIGYLLPGIYFIEVIDNGIKYSKPFIKI